jgi:Tfp pilus assembly protein PilW
VSGDFVVPTVTCTTVKPQDLVSIVEISGGGLSTQAGANAGCQKGSPIYTAGGAAGLVTFHLPVSPGDVISVTATQSASGASVTETDTNSSLTATVSAPGAIATRVEVGNLFNREDVSIPTFSTESFSGAMVDGAAFGTVSYTETPMKGKRRKILISTGPLSSDGTSFTTTFVSP